MIKRRKVLCKNSEANGNRTTMAEEEREGGLELQYYEVVRRSFPENMAKSQNKESTTRMAGERAFWEEEQSRQRLRGGSVLGIFEKQPGGKCG